VKVRNLNWKKLGVVSILVNILLISTLTYVIFASPNGTFTISPGIYPGAPSYTIWKEGSTYYAKNAYGAIDYSGTDAITVIQNVVDALPSTGGYIFLSDDTFTYSTPIVITDKDGIRISGSSQGGTVLDYEGLGYAIVLNSTSSNQRCQIQNLNINLTIYGNGIYLANHYDTRIQSLTIRGADDTNQIGIRLYGPAYWNTISECYIRNVGIGIQIDNLANDNDIIATHIYTITYGIRINRGAGTKIIGGSIDDFDTAIYVNSSRTRISNMYIESFRANALGISITSNAVSTTIVAPYIELSASPVTYKVYNDGYNTRVYGSEFQNAGTTIVANGEHIAHSLLTTPTTVEITPRSTTYDGVTFVVAVIGRNSTHFQVGATWTNGTNISADAIIIDWYAEYVP